MFSVGVIIALPSNALRWMARGFPVANLLDAAFESVHQGS
jgi:hypothetical protein